jgi:uncharacterized membrane protein YoaK (UPF0700 family)
LKHNLQIASLLSSVAGLVNVAGFLAFERLTTNVTGHFAFLVGRVYKLNLYQALMFAIYIFCFFFGSFVSSLLVESISRKSEKYVFVVPALIEISFLLTIGFVSNQVIMANPNIVACCLLFSMGLQNSLVTTISNAAVRTTHLTGLFTDLGIELSELFFYRTPEQKHKLYSSIKLRLTIIAFFFLGGVLSALLYGVLQTRVLVIGSALLIFGLLYDTIQFRLMQLRKNTQIQKTGL